MQFTNTAYEHAKERAQHVASLRTKPAKPHQVGAPGAADDAKESAQPLSDATADGNSNTRSDNTAAKLVTDSAAFTKAYYELTELIHTTLNHYGLLYTLQPKIKPIFTAIQSTHEQTVNDVHLQYLQLQRQLNQYQNDTAQQLSSHSADQKQLQQQHDVHVQQLIREHKRSLQRSQIEIQRQLTAEYETRLASADRSQSKLRELTETIRRECQAELEANYDQNLTAQLKTLQTEATSLIQKRDQEIQNVRAELQQRTEQLQQQQTTVMQHEMKLKAQADSSRQDQQTIKQLQQQLQLLTLNKQQLQSTVTQRDEQSTIERNKLLDELTATRERSSKLELQCQQVQTTHSEEMQTLNERIQKIMKVKDKQLSDSASDCQQLRQRLRDAEGTIQKQQHELAQIL